MEELRKRIFMLMKFSINDELPGYFSSAFFLLPPSALRPSLMDISRADRPGDLAKVARIIIFSYRNFLGGIR
jgi:hypothetical protein